ncbi:MAG TPA: FGGY-family carbohydrate kinase [Leptolyngbya sp.]|jgi:sugar (pentulose or hexulose) kinase|nr:FGGY-family carbohydrate kinase [Leptolyngbya sp.]
MELSLGIDFGTSGARAIVINSNHEIVAQVSDRFTPAIDLAENWKQTLWKLLEALPIEVRSQLSRIAINGTSSTVLLCDRAGDPITAPLLYNDSCGASVLEQIRAIAPAQHTVMSATSSLAKLLWWQSNCESFANAQSFLHQADWLAFQLHGELGISDYHNSLKLGYDVEQLSYPDWLPLQTLMPIVVAPGSPIAVIRPTIAQAFHMPHRCQICAGTTDSIAAFIAAQANSVGEAVTSLGSTLVLKLLSEARIDRAEFGIYSHRFGTRWLVGGASNTGGAVLQHFFTSDELIELSDRIPNGESPLDYYPLLKPGERFPINDPTLAPRLEPRSSDRVEFLHGLLESMARIEAQGYRQLESFGATPLKRILTAGGGAKNSAWTAIRQRQIGVPVTAAAQTEAAYGTAQLAMQGSLETVLD